MSFSFFLARRFFQGNKDGKRKASTPAIHVATAGVAIGLAVMIVSIFVVKGFQHEVKEKITGFGTHIELLNDARVGYSNTMPPQPAAILPPESYPIVTDSSVISEMKNIPGVSHVQRTSMKMGIIKTEDHFKSIEIKGIGEEYDTKFLKSAGIMDNNGELAEMYRSEQKPEEKLSKEEYVKKFKALCDAYEIKLPNREYDIYGLCGDLHKLFGDIRKPAEWSEDIIRKAIEEVGLTQHQINWFKNNVFPPKQEWSEEDKKNFGEAISYIKDDSLRDFLKSLPQRFNLRPKPEWNEEDNRRFRQVIDALDRNGYPLLAGWLESLPGRLTLQPIWKPSKEQMEALKDAFRKDGGNEYRKVINSLYRDLEKLL